MQHQQQVRYGVTPPISENYPTPRDIQVTEQLVETLKAHGQYESDEEARKREIVLGKLNDIFKQFVKDFHISQGYSESMAEEAGGKIFTFGSYRLGVHGRGSDIDTLCVAPKHVKREHFFKDMYELLKARPEVTEITAVSDSYVPVIKFEFSKIPIDLVFAGLGIPSVPDSLELSDDNLLKGLDERCIRSLNGSRVTDQILRLVPNIDNFRIALRCIKHWAKRRAIYSNVMGFFGGVAWAIVVARVCQLYPNAAAGNIVSKFFGLIHRWAWPSPVTLCPMEDGPLAVRVWNPRLYPQDKAHRMPIITPAYPCMCATHNVTASTQHVTSMELKRAADIADRIMAGRGTWDEIFEKDDFFIRYKHYLKIVASTLDEETHLKWSGLVESRLRQLVMKLEGVEAVEYVHPYIKSYDKSGYCSTEEEMKDAFDGIFRSGSDVKPETDTGAVKFVYTTTFYFGLQIASTEGPKGKRKLDMHRPVDDFKKMVESWDKFQLGVTKIRILPLKSSQLPGELFENGIHPKSAEKRSKAQKQSRKEEPAAKRRKLSPAPDADVESFMGEEHPLDTDNGPAQPAAEKRQASEADGSNLLTQSGSLPGTPPGMSPSPNASLPYGGMSGMGINIQKQPEIKLRLAGQSGQLGTNGTNGAGGTDNILLIGLGIQKKADAGALDYGKMF
ncbi:polynucleotide adenylyltransferase [Borealophlyctis nickersoniae]|nr:polynucleotide adenylyltransferase [Borealophlyctis nickersoniae]